MRIHVTGGTGLIGSHVAEQLRRRGVAVTALVRPTSDTAHLESIGCELVPGDVLDAPEALAEGMRGADAVVHAAAVVFQRARRELYEKVNIEGTDRVLRAAALAGALRVVHVSSVAVYYREDPEAAEFREDDWRREAVPPDVVYAHTKQRSEERAWAVHHEGLIRLTTVRPAVVYGERDRSATPILARWASLPVIPVLHGGHATVPVVYAGNVARGILAALDRPESTGRAYNLAEDQPVTLRALLGGFAMSLGSTPRFASVPAVPVALGARLLDRVTRMTPGLDRTRARRAVRMLTRGNPYDVSRARLELGWSNLVPHEAAIRWTARWWQERTEHRQTETGIRWGPAAAGGGPPTVKE